MAADHRARRHRFVVEAIQKLSGVNLPLDGHSAGLGCAVILLACGTFATQSGIAKARELYAKAFAGGVQEAKID